MKPTLLLIVAFTTASHISACRVKFVTKVLSEKPRVPVPRPSIPFGVPVKSAERSRDQIPIHKLKFEEIPIPFDHLPLATTAPEPSMLETNVTSSAIVEIGGGPFPFVNLTWEEKPIKKIPIIESLI